MYVPTSKKGNKANCCLLLAHTLVVFRGSFARECGSSLSANSHDTVSGVIEETSQVQEQNKANTRRDDNQRSVALLLLRDILGRPPSLPAATSTMSGKVAWLQVCEAMCVCASYEMYCCLVRGEGGELTTHAKHTR